MTATRGRTLSFQRVAVVVGSERSVLYTVCVSVVLASVPPFGVEAYGHVRSSHPGLGSKNLIGHDLRRLALSTNEVFHIPYNRLTLRV